MSTKSDIKMHKQILLSISLLEFEALIRSVFQGELEKHLRTPVKASTDYISAKEAAGILKISDLKEMRWKRHFYPCQPSNTPEPQFELLTKNIKHEHY
jgi:predicted transposase YbfD/YdcC